MDPIAKVKFRSMLLDEVKNGTLGWYYISVAGATFAGGYIIQARGPSEAWALLHALGWYEEHCSTQTHGPISDEVMSRVTEDTRWRRLTADEARTVGKPK